MDIWKKIIEESELVVKENSSISSLYRDNILSFSCLEDCVSNYIFSLLRKHFSFEESFKRKMNDFFRKRESIEVVKKDLYAAYKRDPACSHLSNVLLFYKGFHALCVYRLGHFCLTEAKDAPTALLLQYISSIDFTIDINPYAKIGQGIFIDHAHSVVIGETCVIKDYVSILQNVTLGGTGKERGDRHPKIGEGVLIGAGAKILGNIKVGEHSIIGASSVVLKDIPKNSIVVGIPAKVIKKNLEKYPADDLNHSLIN